MRAVIIAQIVLPGASEYERKAQRVDLESLRGAHEVVTLADPRAVTRADVAHVYGPPILPSPLFRGFRIPYIANGSMPRRRLLLQRAPEPEYVTAPIAAEEVELLPEAVEERYWEPRAAGGRERSTIGSFARAANRTWIEQTMARIHRTRDDVDWLLFERPPEPEDLAALDLWVDPVVRDDDYDGFVAEAQVAGVAVAGGRTPVNVQRLEKGRTGVLVPPGDPNEMSHAILTALFKPESAQQRLAAARQTISKYRPRQRLRVLGHMYETLAQ
jgi:hypothetical protein